jgi:RNA polymerase sigma-70 factor (ECF subfamily)
MPPECLEVALDRATGGDEAAVATLYRSLNPLLLRYLRHHVGRVAEDVASDVWLALAPQMADFDGGPDRFRALMFTIARRRVVDEYRRNGRQTPTVSFDDEYAEAFDQTDAGDTEAQAIAGLTAQSAVEALVRGLPEDQAEIVLLRVLGDLDVGQVADIVGKTNGAVRIAQHRALQRLRQTWAEKFVTR